MHSKVPSSEFGLGPKLAPIICFTNVIQLLTAAPVVWRLTIYKSYNLSWLNLVQFLKLGPKKVQVEKRTQKYQVWNSDLDPNLHPLFAPQMSLSTQQTAVAVGPRQLSLSTHIPKPQQTFQTRTTTSHKTKL